MDNNKATLKIKVISPTINSIEMESDKAIKIDDIKNKLKNTNNLTEEEVNNLSFWYEDEDGDKCYINENKDIISSARENSHSQFLLTLHCEKNKGGFEQIINEKNEKIESLNREIISLKENLKKKEKKIEQLNDQIEKYKMLLEQNENIKISYNETDIIQLMNEQEERINKKLDEMEENIIKKIEKKLEQLIISNNQQKENLNLNKTVKESVFGNGNNINNEHIQKDEKNTQKKIKELSLSEDFEEFLEKIFFNEDKTINKKHFKTELSNKLSKITKELQKNDIDPKNSFQIYKEIYLDERLKSANKEEQESINSKIQKCTEVIREHSNG